MGGWGRGGPGGRSTQAKVLIGGVFFHCLMLSAVLEVYYSSPIVEGMTPHQPRGVPPAKRLVLFVADGLRAQSFFPFRFNGPNSTAFLEEVMEGKGSWGVSHTRVPTESRPGHVALIAGLYEDVSAITKGWKENPVEFDSLFNRSSTTWSWGSQDILPMFAKGASGDHVFTSMYDTDTQDFASVDASRLDTWVFEKVHDFFAEARSNFTLRDRLNKDGVVLFLHLLGIDTNGHGFGPESAAYLDNIRLVDEGVKNISLEVENFFENDQRTAFVFTSDHGMTNWRSHGAGDPQETMTPLVVWGAGVKKNGKRRNGLTDWLADWDSRRDVEQADVAALMAALIGVPFPINSVGKLPIQYLDVSEKYLYQASCANFQQILAQFQRKRELKLSQSFRIFFKEFSRLTPAKVEIIQKEIAKMGSQKRFKAGAELCLDWIATSLEGFLYYHQYERTFLTIVIIAQFASWILIVYSLTKDLSNSSVRFCKCPSLPALGVGMGIVVLLFLQSLPATFYVYCLCPVYFFDVALSSFSIRFWRQTLSSSSFFKGGLLAFLGSCLLVSSFHWRQCISLVLVGMGLAVFTPRHPLPPLPLSLRLSWLILSLATAVFPFLPAVGQSSSVWLVGLGGALPLFRPLLFRSCRSRAHLITVGLLLVSVGVAIFTHTSVEAKKGVPFLCHLWSWAMLLLWPLLPFTSGKNVETRLSSLESALLLSYILMSTSYEGIFYTFFSSLLTVWLKLELVMSQGTEKRLSDFEFESVEESEEGSLRPLESEDWRRAFVAVFFIFLAFFGTGNLASLNSFNPSFLRCFATVFDPFLMGSLLALKILLPFVILAVALRGLEILCHRSTLAFLLPVLIYSDLMALVFYFSLKDTGSWLEIGTSISHLVISVALTVFFSLLHLLAAPLAAFSFRRSAAAKLHSL